MKKIVLLSWWVFIQRLIPVIFIFTLSSATQAGQFFELAERSCLDKVDDLPFLTVKKCRTFRAQLAAGKCIEASDMSKGNNFGSKGAFAFFSKAKKVKNENKRLICDLGDGVYSSWSAGGKGKNKNLVFVVPVYKQNFVYIEPDRRTHFSDPIQSNNLQVLPGFGLKNCWGNTQFINGVLIGGQSTLQSNGYYDQ